MLKRVLLYLKSTDESTAVIKYGKMLNERYGCHVAALYVKDIRKYEVITPAVEGGVVDSSAGYAFTEWEKIEERNSEILRKEFIDCIASGEFICEEGLAADCILETLMGYDLVILPKCKKICNETKEILKIGYKPVVLVPDSADIFTGRVLFADDAGLYANKSIGAFMSIFDDVKEITSISVDTESTESTDTYIRSRGIKVTNIVEEKEPVNRITEKSESYDIVVMGNLKYFFLLEKLTGKTGANLMEKLNKPIFIG